MMLEIKILHPIKILALLLLTVQETYMLVKTEKLKCDRSKSLSSKLKETTVETKLKKRLY